MAPCPPGVGIHGGGALGLDWRGPGAVGARGGVRPPAPLPTPAVSSKFTVVRGGDVSISSNRGIPEVPLVLEAVAPTVEVLAMVSVEEAIAA